MNSVFCRWLLFSHDCLQTDEIILTQEIISHLLGVRREGGTVAGTLRKRGLITSVRGVLTILDNAGLKAASCGCYEEIKAEYDNFLGLKS